MKKLKKDIVFYRTKKGSLAYFYPEGDPEAYRARKSAGKLKGPIKRELGNRKRYDNVEEETVRYRIREKKEHGSFSLGEGVLEDGDKKEERDMAQVLYRDRGGNMHVRGNQEHDKGESNPDYDWDSRLWDLKTNKTPTKTAIKNRTHKGLEQISRNPGGVIVDIKSGLPVHRVKGYTRERLSEGGEKGSRVLIMKDGKIKAVWKRK